MLTGSHKSVYAEWAPSRPLAEAKLEVAVAVEVEQDVTQLEVEFARWFSAYSSLRNGCWKLKVTR